MPNVALRGVPDHVHRRIKDAARANHRSMNGEILARLAASVSAAPMSEEELRQPAGARAPSPNGAGAGRAGAPLPSVATSYEPLTPEEIRERARALRERIDARGGIDASPEMIEALIQEGRRR